MTPPTLTIEASTALYILGGVAVVAFFVGRGTAYDLVRDVTHTVCEQHREFAEERLRAAGIVDPSSEARS